MAVYARLGCSQETFHLAELGVCLLQLGGALGEHIEPIVVSNRHLIGKSAQVPGEPCDLFGQGQPTAAQLGQRAAGRLQ